MERSIIDYYYWIRHKKQVAKVEKEEAEAKAAEERKLAEENGEIPPEEPEPVTEGKEEPPAKVLRARRKKEKWLEKRKNEPTSSDHVFILSLFYFNLCRDHQHKVKNMKI